MGVGVGVGVCEFVCMCGIYEWVDFNVWMLMLMGCCCCCCCGVLSRVHTYFDGFRCGCAHLRQLTLAIVFRKQLE